MLAWAGTYNLAGLAPRAPWPALLPRLIEALIESARGDGCYKVILDCAEGNVPFYEKAGLVRKEVQMVRGQKGCGREWRECPVGGVVARGEARVAGAGLSFPRKGQGTWGVAVHVENGGEGRGTLNRMVRREGKGGKGDTIECGESCRLNGAAGNWYPEAAHVGG